jgi:hypothetical protein
MNLNYDLAFGELIGSAWKSEIEYTCEATGARLYAAPFRCAVLPEVFESSLLLSVKQAILGSRFNHKSNELVYMTSS